MVSTIFAGECLGLSEHHIVGDLHAEEVLECLSFIVVLYGEQVILLQYFQHTRELVRIYTVKPLRRGPADQGTPVLHVVYICSIRNFLLKGRKK